MIRLDAYWAGHPLDRTRTSHLARGLDPAERQLAAAREQDRHLALRLLAELPGARLAALRLY